MVLLVLLCPIIFLPFSDFHRAPGNDHFFSANTAVMKWMYNHEIYQWSFYDGLSTSRSTNCTLLDYSINTEFMKLGVSKLLSQTHLLCYCVSCDEFCQVQYIIVIESVTVLSSTCCFGVHGYLYDHAQGVCFLPLLYTCNSHSLTWLYIHKHTSLKVQTVCIS